MTWPCLTKSPMFTGVAITRPATRGAMSLDSSATKLPVSEIEAGTLRVAAWAVRTETRDGVVEDESAADTGLGREQPLSKRATRAGAVSKMRVIDLPFLV